MALEAYSEANISNSFALNLAGRLLAAGYLIFWHETDVVQTPDGFYYEYRANQQTYLADAAFAARVDSAKGLVTLKGKTSSNPEHPVRPTSDGTVSLILSDIAIPSLSVEVGPQGNGKQVEIGSTVRYRWRHLAIYGYARNEAEQARLRDGLAAWFDEDTWVEVHDHEAQTLASVGLVQLARVSTDSATVIAESEATTYELILNARLEYEA